MCPLHEICSHDGRCRQPTQIPSRWAARLAGRKYIAGIRLLRATNNAIGRLSPVGGRNSRNANKPGSRARQVESDGHPARIGTPSSLHRSP
jgi:hypothetical protein